MGVMQWIESRVALPGDSETFRSQKIAAAILLFVAAISTLVNGLRYQGQGLEEVAWLYMLLAAITFLGLVLLLVVPRYYGPMAVVLLGLSMLINTMAHLVSGGYTSGLLVIQWTIITIVFAVIGPGALRMLREAEGSRTRSGLLFRCLPIQSARSPRATMTTQL